MHHSGTSGDSWKLPAANSAVDCAEPEFQIDRDAWGRSEIQSAVTALYDNVHAKVLGREKSVPELWEGFIETADDCRKFLQLIAQLSRRHGAAEEAEAWEDEWESEVVKAACPLFEEEYHEEIQMAVADAFRSDRNMHKVWKRLAEADKFGEFLTSEFGVGFPAASIGLWWGITGIFFCHRRIPNIQARISEEDLNLLVVLITDGPRDAYAMLRSFELAERDAAGSNPESAVAEEPYPLTQEELDLEEDAEAESRRTLAEIG